MQSNLRLGVSRFADSTATPPAVLNVAPAFDPDYPFREVTADPNLYHLRHGEAPGRWTGTGAAELGLAGEVTPAALRALFSGKHPATGAYLASARGSAGRAAARRGTESLEVAAAAARLGLSADAVRARLRRGRLAGEQLASGQWRIPAEAVAAALEGRPQPQAPGPLPSPAVDGTLSLAEAARLAGTSRAWLARIVVESAPEVLVRDDGKTVQYLVGRRNERGRWRIASVELDRFVACREAPRVVPAYDLAIRAPKSVSILHALAPLIPRAELAARGLPADVAGEVEAAHRAAVADVVGVLERHAAFIRHKGGRVAARGLTVAAFEHRSSRAGDPLLHTHLVVANLATGTDGRTAALDGTALYAWARAAGHVYQARLRAELTARLGVAFHSPHHGLADLVGMPRAVIEEFSERRRQMAELLGALGAAGPRAAQAAVLATRAAKGTHAHQSPQELATRAARVGFSPRDLLGLLGRGRAPQRAVPAVAAALASPDGLTARATRVDVRDALCGFADGLAAGATAAQLETWATRLLHDPARFLPVVGPATDRADVIRRGDGRRVGAGAGLRTYSTPELLAQEARLVAAHAEGLGPDGAGIGRGVATAGAVEAALAGRPSLRAEQLSMVRAITRSGVGVEVVVGGPGTGKTFALGAAAGAWRACGYRVLGAALQGGAAEVLAAEAGLDEQRTLTALLARCDRAGPGYLRGSVVVVDEAGMADTRQLSRLVAYAAAAQAKVVLVGDPDQIPEVGAGGGFRHLVERVGPAVVALSENHRQTHAGDRARLGMIRQGRAAAAIASARADGRWHTAASADAVRAALLADWHDDPGEIATDKLLVATTVAEVERLNAAARVLLAAEGRLGTDALVIPLAAPDRAVAERELRVGERVRAARNDYRRGLFTGRVGTVVALDAARFEVTVALDPLGAEPGRWVRLGREYLTERAVARTPGVVELERPGLSHAYAATANAVQGRTSARAYVLVTEAGLHRQGAYVASSRARESTHYYAVTVEDADELARHEREALAPIPDPGDASALAQAMGRDASQTMASVADPRAGEVGALLAVPTAWLWAERAELARRLGRVPLPEALGRVRSRLADAYRLGPEVLEARPLSEAMTRALQVPGATPERLALLMLRRHQGVTRELGSARDPLAVLVWAAGTHAVEVLSREAEDRRRRGRPREALASADEARLGVVEAALARQREGRLAMVESEIHGPVAGLLGAPPSDAAGLGIWRRGAAVIVDHRDAAGIFDRELGGPDPWARALGPRPEEPAPAADHDRVRAVVEECRLALALAGLRRRVPAEGDRPGPEVAALAERPLAVLHGERTVLRSRLTGRRGRAESDAVRRLRLQRGGPTPPEAKPTGSPAGAQPGEEATRTRIGHLDQAIALRRRRVRATVLGDPPPWMTAAIDRHLRATGNPGEVDLDSLANHYGDLAVALDRAGQALDRPPIPDMVASAVIRRGGAARDRRPAPGLWR